MKRFSLPEYWSALLAGDETAIASFFLPDARIFWHNTNECFTVPEFIRVNKEYPDIWKADIQYELSIGEFRDELLVCAVRVYSEESGASFHCCSAMRLREGLISSIDEYWSEDGRPPEWRLAMGIGRPIV